MSIEFMVPVEFINSDLTATKKEIAECLISSGVVRGNVLTIPKSTDKFVLLEAFSAGDIKIDKLFKMGNRYEVFFQTKILCLNDQTKKNVRFTITKKDQCAPWEIASMSHLAYLDAIEAPTWSKHG